MRWPFVRKRLLFISIMKLQSGAWLVLGSCAYSLICIPPSSWCNFLLTCCVYNCRTSQVWWGTCRHRQQGCRVHSRLKASWCFCKSSCRFCCCIHRDAPSRRHVPSRHPVAAFHHRQPEVWARAKAHSEVEGSWQDQQDLWWLDRREWVGRQALA